jgi:hypothetical protein
VPVTAVIHQAWPALRGPSRHHRRWLERAGDRLR